MSAPSQARSGGRILVEALRAQGVEHAFCVPGESYLAALDALHDAPDIALTVCRQEGGAAMMADAYGKLTNKPGICFVTRGPGAANAAIGLHIAQQDSTPMILFVGQVGRDMIEREAFQEVDFRRFFGQMAKWVAQIDQAERIPEYVGRAFHVATAGRMGPVVLALPEDMLREPAVATPVSAHRPVQAHPSPDDLDRLKDIVESAERPFVIVGGRGWDQTACSGFARFAESFELPVGAAFRCQDLMDNSRAIYAGDVGIGLNPRLAKRIKESDLLLVVGARLGEITTSGYTLVDCPEPRQRLIHVYPGAEELGRVYYPSLAINAGMKAFAWAVADMSPDRAPRWSDWTKEARRDYEDWNAELPQNPGALQLGAIVKWLRGNLPRDAILCNGAGNYTAWLHRFYRYRRFGTQLGTTCGSMGYGTPAAVAAKRLYPERTVVAFAGDGCYLMNGQELATAVQYELAIIIIVVNNGMYGTIRMHQERDYPGRVVGTDLTNPDFAKLAEAYGAFGVTVERSEAFPAAFEAAKADGRPALIELKVDPEALTPTRSLSEIREAAEAGRWKD